MTLTASGPSLRVRTRQLFEQEQRFIAPGLQTIALLSELAIIEAYDVFFRREAPLSSAAQDLVADIRFQARQLREDAVRPNSKSRIDKRD